MEKIRNLSLRKTIILYMAVSLIVSFLLSVAVFNFASYVQQRIWWKYTEQEEYLAAMKGEGSAYEVSIPRISNGKMSDTDRRLSELCDFLETYSGLLIPMTGSIIAVILFYRHKIKIPLQELNAASGRIAANELDFRIDYANRDELGTLCAEFERMRGQLAENNKVMWHMIEEEKALRAAIAHDIRSPLAVLRGYQEMLLEFMPSETFDKREMEEMLQESMGQVDRINGFVDTVANLSRLEERELQRRETDSQSLKAVIARNVEMLGRGSGIFSEVDICGGDRSFAADTELILEVVDNLYANALRFAKEKVQITISATEEELTITVADDGAGFTEDAETLTKAHYHANPQDDLSHFGMGMYISRIFCEKHGGRLLTANQDQGGAIVKAIFKTGSI